MTDILVIKIYIRNLRIENRVKDTIIVHEVKSYHKIRLITKKRRGINNKTF